jgi:hypothetical protein
LNVSTLNHRVACELGSGQCLHLSKLHDDEHETNDNRDAHDDLDPRAQISV